MYKMKVNFLCTGNSNKKNLESCFYIFVIAITYSKKLTFI